MIRHDRLRFHTMPPAGYPEVVFLGWSETYADGDIRLLDAGCCLTGTSPVAEVKRGQELIDQFAFTPHCAALN